MVLYLVYLPGILIFYFSAHHIRWTDKSAIPLLYCLVMPFLIGIMYMAFAPSDPIPEDRQHPQTIWLSYPVILLLAMFISFVVLVATTERRANKNVSVDLLQINDVYEIAALDSGRIGGMARVATLRRRFEVQNPNTMLLIAGDFISPSVFNNVKTPDGAKVQGKQMVQAMNDAGVDLAIFGNHEFDVSRSVLQQRINESHFQWVASNVLDSAAGQTQPFARNGVAIPSVWRHTFRTEDGNAVTIGFFGITIPDNKGAGTAYVAYSPPLDAAIEAYQSLEASCDAVIAITHQDMKDDSALALKLPHLLAIIGGHEHDQRDAKVGNVYITKALANAKNAFHLHIRFSNDNEPTVVKDCLALNESVLPDPTTQDNVDKWMDIAFGYFRSQGFHPESPIRAGFAPPQLEGRDSYVRSGPTNLTRIIVDAMAFGAKETYSKAVDLAILNSGSIRIDDAIAPPVTEYSLLRALPFSDTVRVAVLKGKLIARLLDANKGLKDNGAFLQYSDGLQRASSGWTLDGHALIDTASYTVAIGNYLLTGQQRGLGFIADPGAGIVFSLPSPTNYLSSVAKTVINYLQKCDADTLKKYYP